MKNIKSKKDLKVGMYLYMSSSDSFFKNIIHDYSILKILEIYNPKYKGKYDTLVKVPWNPESQLLTIDILKTYCKIIQPEKYPEYFL